MSTVDIVEVSFIASELKFSESEVLFLARRLGYQPWFIINGEEYFAREAVNLMKSRLAEKRQEEQENEQPKVGD